MDIERRDHAASPTPMLDSLIAQLPPAGVELLVAVELTSVAQARDRLLSKIQAGTLTKKAVEDELSTLPSVGGMEAGKIQLVRFIQTNVPDNDINKLPVE